MGYHFRGVHHLRTAVNAPEQDSLLRGEPGVHHHDYGSAYHPHCNVLPRRHSSDDGEPYAKEKNSKIRCQYAKEGGRLWPELTERTENDAQKNYALRRKGLQGHSPAGLSGAGPEKTDAYRTQLMRELYTAHPDWIPAEEAGKIVFDSRMAQFDADMAFVRKQASTRAAKAISKDPACAEREEEKLQQLQKEHEELRNQYSCRLQREISAQLTDMPGDGAEREAAVSDIERKVDAFRAEQEKAAQKQMETIRQAEDSKIQKLSDALGKLQLTPADRPGLPEGVVLRVQDLCMYFGGVHAVDGLSFDVKKGEIFGLIGPNGAGKTTVFNCITQFYKPTSGTLLFENKAGEVISLPEEKVHDVVLQGIVRTFQNVEVIREVSVLDNLLIAGHRQFTAGILSQALHLPTLKKQERIIREKALRVLEFMGLTEYRDWYAAGLPYGILKKIEIARTLMCDPQLIILDEPAAGLNDTETLELAELIRRIRDTMGCTILLVEHDMGLVMNICQTVCAISFGKLLAIGTPEEIQKDPQVQKAYLGESDEEVEK